MFWKISRATSFFIFIVDFITLRSSYGLIAALAMTSSAFQNRTHIFVIFKFFVKSWFQKLLLLGIQSS